MFDSLEDQIQADLKKQSTSTERLLRYAAVAVASILIFGSLFLGVRYLE